jgi:CubicO group peptidase (beta-lactamase class C family)
MTRPGSLAVLLSCLAALLLAPAAASAAAKTCPEPGEQWNRATPAEAGMDAAKLQDAMDYGTANLGFAVRVYRRGCLVAEDRAAAVNRNQTFESWSMAKSVTAMIFMRAMTLGLISPDDVVGSLVPEADKAHGAIAMRDLLTMTSGLKWNGLRDYNIFTMPDRIVDALTLEPVHKPGTFYEYAQSPVSLLAEAIGRAAGEDVEAFAQRELLDPLGIPADAWHWNRDRAGHVGGFWGVNMRPDDFGRLGELMRREGLWRGQRLIRANIIRTAITPTPTNGCYGWLIWLNRGSPCVGPTISERPVDPNREWPDLPVDLYHFSGLFGQLVTVFPSQDLVVVRTGQDRGLVFAGGSSWEHDLYAKVLGAITDTEVRPAGDAKVEGTQNADYGFQTALQEPDQYSKGVAQDPLPPAGPQRARAAQLQLNFRRVGRRGDVTIRVGCPPRPSRPCAGTATLTGARKAASFSVAPGDIRIVRFKLTRRALEAARKRRTTEATVVAVTADAAEGVRSALDVRLAKPYARKAKRPRDRGRSRTRSRA